MKLCPKCNIPNTPNSIKCIACDEDLSSGSYEKHRNKRVVAQLVKFNALIVMWLIVRLCADITLSGAIQWTDTSSTFGHYLGILHICVILVAGNVLLWTYHSIKNKTNKI